PEAVLNLSREGDGIHSLQVMLNVTRELPNAVITILNGTRPVASAHESLSPQKTFRKTFPGLPASATYTIELRNETDEVLLRHTEGQSDFVSRDKVQLGKQPSHEYPAEPNRGADDFLALGTDQESNGELPVAHTTYQRGLARFPNSIALNRAAGRLEVVLKHYEPAAQHLSKALSWVNSDHETAYY